MLEADVLMTGSSQMALRHAQHLLAHVEADQLSHPRRHARCHPAATAADLGDVG
eukprot:CAMPEP_0115752522 /NCGR_PEP_ID=MMETSP0272-20121206/95835_1 /TAXON_ID=71861 /ORGANISM="Scrippsiella trochoidea, Strain CCMP3099" /LENGTH=53 /DNA_ID=CAMNT_0003197775 /DNA_START=19 /DNA_END=180 /DNA_ORIENTATION=+